MQTAPPPYPPATGYPLTFSVDYPDKPLNRLTSFFRLLWIIPIAVIAGLLGSGTISQHGSGYAWQWAVGGLLFLPLVLMLLFRKKYPRWWFDWNLQLTRFLTRVWVYAALLRDEYPSTDEEQAVHLDFAYPDAQQLSRGLPLDQVVPGHPALDRALLPDDRSRGLHGDRVVRDPVHRQVPKEPVRLRGRGAALVAAGLGVRRPAGHRPVPAVQTL